MRTTDYFEFRRRIDGVSYRFKPAAPRAGHSAWKRVDIDVWLVWSPESGWCVVDGDGVANARPWNVELAHQREEPPEGEWISKLGDKSYVYDLVRFDHSDADE